jgi:hypothetical protein
VDLFRRLPRLLQDRWANFSPDWPKTVRLTVRYVPDHPRNSDRFVWQRGRNNSVTTSQQYPIDGMQLFEAPSLQRMSDLLHAAVEPLLRSLLMRVHLNVTRINVCLADFQVLPASSPTTGNNAFFQLCSSQRECSNLFLPGDLTMDLGLHTSQFGDTMTISSPRQQRVSSRATLVTHTRAKRVASPCLTYDSLDPAVLEELPPDIAHEVRNALALDGTKPKKQRKAPKTLDQYFAPRSRPKEGS